MSTKVNMESSVDLILSPCKRGFTDVYRITMVQNMCELEGVKPPRHTPPPIREVIIQKQTLRLPAIEHPDEVMSFITTRLPDVESEEPYRERREVHFWFLAEVPLHLRHKLVMDYFRRLVKAEGFPKGHTEFVQRALLLLQYFPAFRRVELQMKPAALVEDDIESEEEEEVRVKKLSLDDLMRDEDSEEEEELVENFITVLTPAVYDYQYLPEVNVTHKTHVTFRVRAKSNAYIALSSVYGETSDKTYEIVIGGWENTKSVLRSSGSGPSSKETITPGIVSDEELRPFWISWKKQVVEVGEGSRRGQGRFLHWKVPKSKQHSVNCMSVSTGEGATGEWEFVELLAPVAEEATTSAGRRLVICQALLKEAKKRQLLMALEHAFPSTLDTEKLLRDSRPHKRLAKVAETDMMSAVAVLKEAETAGLVAEVARGTWMRSPRSKMDRDIQLLKMAAIAMTTPTIAIFTELFCEKLAVDAMMESKISYVQYENDNPKSVCQVYTVGKIGDQHVVSLKISGVDQTSNGSGVWEAVRKIFVLFPNIEHVISVGVAGAVPHFSSYERHVRLGDVVVSYPLKGDHPSYVHCQNVSKTETPGFYDYSTREWRSLDSPLIKSLKQLNSGFQTDSFITSTMEKYVKDAQQLLRDEDGMVFDRPGPKTDRLFMEDEYGEKVFVQHPKPLNGRAPREGQSRIHYGIPAGGKFVPCDYQMRLEFADMHNVLCYDGGDSSQVLEAVEDCQMTSYVVIRGMGDYIDGRRNLDWQPYAALSAAAYMKLMLRHLQPSHRRY